MSDFTEGFGPTSAARRGIDEGDFAQGFRAGYDAGFEQARQEVIGWLRMKARAMEETNWGNQDPPLRFAPGRNATAALVVELEQRAKPAQRQPSS